jgi:flagellar biosynthetic protein FlhB
VSDSAEKPFDPTARRIAKAQREGNVARSSELAANLAFAAASSTVAAIAPLFVAAARNALVAGASGRATLASTPILAYACLCVGAAALAGTLGNLAQNGGLAGMTIALKFERLNPIEGIKRILSRETLAHSLRAAFAFACASAAMAPFVVWSATASLQASGLVDVAATAWTASREVAVAACTVGFCFAVAEYGAARRGWLRKLRMSFEERKREVKEEEGDAVARGRRRSLHRALLRSGMGRLREAAFVVANPQHVAVALEYRPPKVPVPRVLVRAADEAAVAVRALAKRYGIPIVENVALARALFAEVRTGDSILPVHYVAVAEVVAALSRASSSAP